MIRSCVFLIKLGNNRVLTVYLVKLRYASLSFRFSALFIYGAGLIKKVTIQLAPEIRQLYVQKTHLPV